MFRWLHEAWGKWGKSWWWLVRLWETTFCSLSPYILHSTHLCMAWDEVMTVSYFYSISRGEIISISNKRDRKSGLFHVVLSSHFPFFSFSLSRLRNSYITQYIIMLCTCTISAFLFSSGHYHDCFTHTRPLCGALSFQSTVEPIDRSWA